MTVPGHLYLSIKQVNNILDDGSSIKETKDDQEIKNRGVPLVLPEKELPNRKAEKSWDLHNS